MKILDKIKLIILGPRATSESYIKFLKKSGVQVGKGIKIFRPYNTTIDVQNPHLLSIGDYVQITGPVTILTHDYSWSVLKRKYGVILGNERKTKIGNNVFIGWGATILGGANIGDNVIIGANSVVSGRVEANSVYAGNPAKKLMTLDDFKAKRENRQLDEAVNYVCNYKKQFGCWPKEENLVEYFFLFKPSKIYKTFDYQLRLVDNYKKSKERLMNTNFKFESYEEFLDYCKQEFDYIR